MQKLKTILIIQGFLFLVFWGTAQQAGLEKIDTVDIKKYLDFIASDELQGRKLGLVSNGLNLAASYIAENTKHFGLKPGTPDYFQKVDIVSTRPDKNNFIEVVDHKGRSKYKTENLINIHRRVESQLLVDIPVVLAGFGKNLSSADLNGKAVILSLGSEETCKNGNFGWNNRLEQSKIDFVTALNPRLIILVTSPDDKHNNVFNQLSNWFNRERLVLVQPNAGEGMLTLLVLPDFVDALLGGKGKYKKYLKELVAEKELVPQQVPDRNINLKAGTRSTIVDAKNVVAVLEGSDPDLKNEYVLFMAHYDHIGLDNNGKVYNGADDNGSGTVAVLEIAEAFASLESEPKRSVVFLWVTGEEIGLLGSEYYTMNPVFPLEKTVACFNLDMVGRVFEPRDTVWNKSSKRVKKFDELFVLSNNLWPELSEINKNYCAQLGLEPDTTLSNIFLRSSDHYYFHQKGVPIINYATGYHADYHTVGDVVEKINFAKMKRVADLCFLVGLEVANRKDVKIQKHKK